MRTRRSFNKAAFALLTTVPATVPALISPSVAAASSRRRSKEMPGGSAPSNESKSPPPSRQPYTESEQRIAQIPGIPDARFWGDSENSFARALPSIAGPWLALSAGGGDGAYGAGVLNGWSRSGQRPTFSVVSGVSTGALIAPFAFLGSRYDRILHERFVNVTAADIFEVGETGESLLNTWPLKKLISQSISDELVSEVAAEHQLGRRLFIVTTNLDAERPVVWNMGAIASAPHAEAPKLFRDVLLASASIPAVFPPVYIKVTADSRSFEEMHVDGGLFGSF
ncbi:MAG TPA: patatin-like phospholipase family protein, partial [Xanthobacteraceae bacterium]|nr:patatin-like phospholipase family protein [Xanthobacteraceae bacterium]